MKDVEETLTGLIDLPRRHNDLGVSVLSLLRDSGYFENYSRISEDLISRELLKDPAKVPEWAQFSEDKFTSGWHLIRKSNNTFEVEYTAEKGETCEATARQYEDEVKACAAFIKLEVEGIRLRHSHCA